MAKLDQKNTFFLFVSFLNEAMFEGLGENFRKILIPLHSDNRPLRVFYEQVLIPYYVRKYKIDILFSPGNIAILFPGCKQVTTIHDLHYRFIPEVLDQSRVLYYRLMLPISTRRSDYIIVDSQATKRALLETVNYEPERIRTIYLGVNFSPKVRNWSPSGNNLEPCKGHILFVSTLFPFKNAAKLIRAYAEIADKITYPVVIVGLDPGGQISVLKKLASSLGIAERVHFMGRVDSVEPWYDSAVVFVYPSEQEGFGLPILEAMACGTPVIASNRASIPEVVGDAGITVNPDNIDELAEAILKVISNQDLREELIKKGYQRVKEFSWEKTARQTLEVFEEVWNG